MRFLEMRFVLFYSILFFILLNSIAFLLCFILLYLVFNQNRIKLVYSSLQRRYIFVRNVNSQLIFVSLISAKCVN
jgi:hypothetical protein